MRIRIDDKEIEINNGETVLEAANRTGAEIPALCYAKGFKHKASCMICVVKNQTDGQIIPSCSTYPEEGMKIETDSEEIRAIRLISLELLLSDHRADCEAPCALVCPNGLEVEQMLTAYDAGRFDVAFSFISEAFSLPVITCDTCKAPCEKACRRVAIDKTVAIRDIIRQIVGLSEWSKSGLDHRLFIKLKTDKQRFQSRLGRFTSNEKKSLQSSVTTSSRCLHCACTGRNNCKLRTYATSMGIKRSRYESSSAIQSMIKRPVNGNMWFEPAKCIRCGLCVFNSHNGFTFKDRGFNIQVILPDENRANINEELASLCPTGALYIQP